MSRWPVGIDGAAEIYLYVTGAPEVEYGAGDWIAPRAIDANGKDTLLCSGRFLDIQQGFHTVDCSLRSRVNPPLLIADEMFDHGINLQAPGKIRVKLPKGTVRFEAEIGIDDWVNPGTYKLPQPYYYQPHHYSTAALRKGDSIDDAPPNGAVRFHVADAAGAARLDLWTRLADEFSQETPRRQMKREREDRLLEEDWNPGDWRTLALRYAEASGRVAGLRGIPRGTVKSLRVFTYHFAYQKQAGIKHRVGADGPWEVKQVLGTVPVEPDGSAFFRVPAKTPISLQPLDEEGKALQLMRSWLTVMPGETRSCVGCHEDNTGVPPAAIHETIAGLKSPVSITPWYGPTRGFSFAREVQPVLDKYCVGCHDGSPSKDGAVPCDLRAEQNVIWAYQHGNPELIRFEDTPLEELTSKYSGLFSPSYVEMRKQIRVGGLESDLHLLPAMEFHANTSRLVQMLEKGHHGVRLGPEAWDRLITWIDLNAPSYGTWSEFAPIRGGQDERRNELRAMYGGKPENGETIIRGDPPFGGDLTPVVPQPVPVKSAFLPATGSDRLVPAVSQSTAAPVLNASTVESGKKDYLTLDLGDGVSMRLVRIPAGRVAGALSIDHSFWMGCFEVTNRQYARIDPKHDSRFEHRGSWIFSEEYLGWPLDAPDQPVVRVSWDEASEFCRRLSEQSGRRIRLPSEREWEYACRAGAETPFWFGTDAADFSPYANLADRSLRRLAADSWGPKPPDLAARDDRFDDGRLVTAEVGSFAPNPFGLYDMHGNAAEWTLGKYGEQGQRRTVRGGSWRDLPDDAHASERFGYRPYQKVFHVGFRVVCEASELPELARNGGR